MTSSVTSGSLGRHWGAAAIMMCCPEDAKQLPRAIGMDLQAPVPASHRQGANNPAPGSVCWERDSVAGESTGMAVPSPGTVAGVRLARRNGFEGRTANCFSRCPPRGVLCLVAHVWDPSKDGQPHGPCQHGLMQKTPTSDPGSPPKIALKSTVGLS